jgi:N-acetylglucosaminyldiphosphoundecaprenol N-acetyl-beta-D-mannosaminyltransferase
MLGMLVEAGCSDSVIAEAAEDDFSREVYCILGMPIDVVDMPNVLRRIDFAAATSSRLFLSTPNLNFLMHCHSDKEFRDSLLLSDLSPADGMPIVWLGRLLGAPIKERVAGSDIFAALKAWRGPGQPLKLFLFGGNEGVAVAASNALNAARGAVLSVGSHYPGFLSVEELSQDSIIDTINSRVADFLVVCLGSKKGQLWLKRNADKLRAPIRAHFGAALNFEGGTVDRAPVMMRKLSLEWLWRIKEEPYLWRRYWHDGLFLLRLLYSQVLPLVIYRLLTRNLAKTNLTVKIEGHDACVKLKLVGAAVSQNVKELVPTFRTAVSTGNRIVIDLADVSAIDSRFLGLLLVFRKVVKLNNSDLLLTGVSSELERVFRLNGVDFLLKSSDKSAKTDQTLSFAESSAA